MRPSTVPAKPLSHSRKSEAKRSAIIRVAIDVINLRSFALATMTEIAERLGLRDAALYYYFSSKLALVYACHVSSMERFEAVITSAGMYPGSGLDKIRKLLRLFLEDSERHGQHLYFGDHSYLPAQERESIDVWASRLIARIEEFFEQGIADGSIKPCEPTLAVQLMLGMLIWLGKWAPSVRRLTAERLLNAITAMIIDGIGAPGD